MPIKTENKARYPKNWAAISKDIRTKRAKNKCEVCGVNNYAVGYRNNNGTFCSFGGNIYLDCASRGIQYPSLEPLTATIANQMARDLNETQNERKAIVIILTVAHLDHTPENCDYSNLKAMCQKCHNAYDREHRNETIKQGKVDKGQQNLF